LCAQVEAWLSFARRAVTAAQLPALNAFLATRTYLTGHEITLADVAVWDALHGAPRALPIIVMPGGH
jgi:glutathione S-transferase